MLLILYLSKRPRFCQHSNLLTLNLSLNSLIGSLLGLLSGNPYIGILPYRSHVAIAYLQETLLLHHYHRVLNSLLSPVHKLEVLQPLILAREVLTLHPLHDVGQLVLEYQAGLRYHHLVIGVAIVLLSVLKELSKVNDQISTHNLNYSPWPSSNLHGMLNMNSMNLNVRMRGQLQY